MADAPQQQQQQAQQGNGAKRAKPSPGQKSFYDVIKNHDPKQPLPEEILSQYTEEEIDETYHRLGIEADPKSDPTAREPGTEQEKSFADRINLPNKTPASGKTLQVVDMESAYPTKAGSSNIIDSQFPIDFLKYWRRMSPDSPLLKLGVDDWMRRLKGSKDPLHCRYQFLRLFDKGWPHADAIPLFVQQVDSYLSAVQNSSAQTQGYTLEEWKINMGDRVLRYNTDMHETDHFITLVFLVRADYFLHLVLEKSSVDPSSPAAAKVGMLPWMPPEEQYCYYFHYYAWSETKIDRLLIETHGLKPAAAAGVGKPAKK